MTMESQCGMLLLVLLYCMALSVNFAFSLTTPHGEIDPALQPRLRHPKYTTRNDVPLGEGVAIEARVEREAVEDSSPANSTNSCRVQETSEEMTKIIASEETAYSFFFKPLPGFRKLVFNMMVDNDWDAAVPYEYDQKSVVVNGWELGHDSITDDGWVPVKVEYYRHRVSLSPDRLGLKVAMGPNSSFIRKIYTRNRWTHDYEGFVVYSDGRAEFVTGCIPPSVVLPVHQHHLSASHSELQVQHIKSPVLLLVLSVGGFLLVMMVLVVVLLLVKRGRRSTRRDGPPPPPKQLPKSMLLQGRGQSKGGEEDHIYEDFDEDALAKLRKKLELENLTYSCEDDDEEGSHYSNPPQPVRVHHQVGLLKEGLQKKSPEDVVVEGSSTYLPDRGTMYLNMNLNLQEEKAKAWKEDPDLGTPPEEQYVEMHGIVSRTSSLNKK